jgi:hypothetical protein
VPSEAASGARWVRTAVMFLIDGLRLARLRPTLHTLALPNRGWREDPAEEEKRRRLVFGAGGRTCAAPRLRQSLAALGFGYGLNEERRTKNEERRTKNEERRTKNEERRTKNEERRTKNEERRTRTLRISSERNPSRDDSIRDCRVFYLSFWTRFRFFRNELNSFAKFAGGRLTAPSSESLFN